MKNLLFVGVGLLCVMCFSNIVAFCIILLEGGCALQVGRNDE